MKKKMIWCAILGILAVAALTCGFVVVNAKNKIREEDFLHVEEGMLVNEKGEHVLLQGVNLGGWLLQESWMCPVNGEDRK